MTGGPQILGFGAMSIDDILYVERPLSAGKGRVVDRLTYQGGNVATALVAAATLGGQAGYIGWLPEEASASEEELLSHGVTTDLAPRRPDARAIRATITVGSDGERFIAYDDDVPHGTSEDLPDAVLTATRVLLIDGYAAHSPGVVLRARRLGVSVVADIEWSLGPVTDRLLAAADHLVLPFAFAEQQAGTADPARILRAFWREDRAAVVLTQGARGVHLMQAGEGVPRHIPAHPVTAVDTTGAGDCFHGAYAFALAEGQPPVEAARFANAAAGLAVTGPGGRKSLPTRAACLALLKGARSGGAMTASA